MTNKAAENVAMAPVTEGNMRGEVTISAVVFRSEHHEGRWIAQCIEHDICVSAARLDDLPQRLERQIVSELINNINKGRSGLDGIAPAPQRFREMYEASHTHISYRNGVAGRASKKDAKVVSDLRVFEAA